MRIAVLGPLPPLRGGIAAHTMGAIDALRACGHDVYVVTYGRLYPRWLGGVRPGSDSRPAATAADDVVDCFAPQTWLRAAAGIRAFGPDVVIAQYWTPIALAAIVTVLSRTTAAKRIVVCHNVVPHEAFPGAAALARCLIRRCDGVIFHSRHVLAQARALGCGTPAAVAPVPLLVAFDETSARPPMELATACANDARLFVCAGHVRKYKGLGVVAEAWQRAALGANELLVIVGEPLSARRDLRRLRRLGGAVRVIPRYLGDDELSWLLARADVALFPYVTASQSGLLPVALRLARHVVVSDAGGLPEALPGEPASRGRSAGVTLVAAGDASALAAALRALGSSAAGGSPAAADGALRHVAARISASEQRGSWDPFVSAFGSLIARGRPAGDLE